MCSLLPHFSIHPVILLHLFCYSTYPVTLLYLSNCAYPVTLLHLSCYSIDPVTPLHLLLLIKLILLLTEPPVTVIHVSSYHSPLLLLYFTCLAIPHLFCYSIPRLLLSLTSSVTLFHVSCYPSPLMLLYSTCLVTDPPVTLFPCPATTHLFWYSIPRVLLLNLLLLYSRVLLPLASSVTLFQVSCCYFTCCYFILRVLFIHQSYFSSYQFSALLIYDAISYY